MSSGTKIIQTAYQLIGVGTPAIDAADEFINNGVDRLNGMLQRWKSLGLDLGTTPLLNPGDQVNEPADTTTAIIDNLALELAPFADNGKNIVSPMLKINADKGMDALYKFKLDFEIPDMVLSSTTPVGMGNKPGILFPDYKRKGETVDG